MRRNLLFWAFLLANAAATCQTYIMTGTPIAACNGTFLDSGGALGNYGNNQNLNTTICPDGMGSTHVLLTFDSSMLLAGDVLCFYDGSDVLAPLLACWDDFPAGQPFQIQASANNPNGCLTLSFVSNGVNTDFGWSATISCASPCVIPAPGNVQVVSMTAGNMTWSWGAVPGSTGFEVSVNGGPWQPASGAQTHTVGGLIPGNLVVIEIRPVSANPGCSVESITVNKAYVNCTLDATVGTLAPVSCPGGTNGSATISATGATGTAQFFVVGNPMAFPNGNFINFFAAGAYQVAVHDAAGCRDTVAFSIVAPPPIVIQITVTDAECFGDNSGAIQAAASGGTGALTYSWRRCQGGAVMPGALAIDLFAGCYAVTVTDANGCTAVAQDTIGEPPRFEFSSTQDSVRCFGGMDGRGSVFTSGAIPPYTFKWGNGDTTPTADSLKAGFHSVTVTDAIGCQAVTLVQVLQPSRLTIDSIPITTLPCFESTSGMATVFAKGGVKPYTYLWSSGHTLPAATGLGAGQYTVTLTDNHGCTISGTTQLTAPPEVVVQIAVVQNEICAGICNGQLSLSASGGTPPFLVSWSDPAISPNETMPDNLCPKIYSATVTDAHGCSRIATGEILAAPPLSIQFSGTAPACAGAPTGSLQATGSGGALPYLYIWNSGGSGSQIQNIPCGTYTVTITDQSGCTLAASDTLLCPPPLILDSIVSQPIQCFGAANGNISVFAHGGTGALAYLWNDPNQQATATATNLPPGMYTVTITDANGCGITASATVTESAPITATLTPTAVTCFGGNNGSVQVNAGGGVAPYTYAWNVPQNTPIITGLAAGPYTVTVTDDFGCTFTPPATVVAQPAGPVQVSAVQTHRACAGVDNGEASATALGSNGPPFTFTWSNGATGPNPANFAIGSYTVTVSDIQGCTATQTVSIAGWDSIRINIATILPSCHGLSDGQATVNQVSGGAGNGVFSNYTFQWNIPGFSDTVYVNGLSGNQIFSLTVSDNSGCSMVFTDTLDEQPPIIPVVQVDNVTCFGLNNGILQVTSVQSTRPIALYTWNTGANGQTLTNLPAGTYTVTVSDTQGCTGTAEGVVFEPPLFQLELIVKPLACNNDSNGVVQTLVQGGTPVYTYSWNTGATASTISNLGPGEYTVTATDNEGCTATASTALSQPNPPSLSVEITDPLCFGKRDGFARILVTDGTPPFQYRLNGQPYTNSAVFFGLPAGAYTASVLDGAGCITTISFTLSQPPPIEVLTDPDVTLTLGDSLLLSADAINTAGPASYQWQSMFSDTLYCSNPPECSAVWAYPVFNNSYTVMVTDTNGCIGKATVRVDVEKPRGVYVPTGFSPNSDNNNDLLVVHGKGAQITRVKVFRVFDRWGELVYEDLDFSVNDAQRGWDGQFRGQNCPAGIYVWYAEVEYIDGFEEVVHGNTALIR